MKSCVLPGFRRCFAPFSSVADLRFLLICKTNSYQRSCSGTNSLTERHWALHLDSSYRPSLAASCSSICLFLATLMFYLFALTFNSRCLEKLKLDHWHVSKSFVSTKSNNGRLNPDTDYTYCVSLSSWCLVWGSVPLLIRCNLCWMWTFHRTELNISPKTTERTGTKRLMTSSRTQGCEWAAAQ